MARRIGLRRPRHSSYRGQASYKSPTVYLLPNYDHHISYKDRSAVRYADADKMMDPPANDAFFHYLVVDGQIVGTAAHV